MEIKSKTLYEEEIKSSEMWAVFALLKKGKSGENYNIGSGKNLNNLNLTKILLKI